MLLLKKWRPFCNQFEQIVEDFNFGTLLRIDSNKEYTEENSILGKLDFSIYLPIFAC